MGPDTTAFRVEGSQVAAGVQRVPVIIYIAGDNGPTPEGGLHGVMNKLT